jgi:hypothetical protein
MSQKICSLLILGTADLGSTESLKQAAVGRFLQVFALIETGVIVVGNVPTFKSADITGFPPVHKLRLPQLVWGAENATINVTRRGQGGRLGNFRHNKLIAL